MILYGVESTETRTEWTTSKKHAIELFDAEIDWIEGDEISEDDYVNLMKVDLQEFYDGYENDWDIEEQLEEKATLVKTCVWVEDTEMGNPRDNGHNFDYYISRRVTENNGNDS